MLLAAAGGSLVACSVAASFSEPVDAPFLAILATRTCAFVFALWSVLFAMGFTGRFRIPIYLGLGLGLAVLGGMTDFDLRRFGPVAVASPQTMAHERVVLPVRAITESLAFGSAWTVTAFALALIREGSVAESLARRMSQKEKSLVGMLFLGLIVAVSFLDRKKTKQPLTFSNERYALTSAHERLEVLFLHGAARADAEALLAALEADLVGLRRALDWQSTPPLRVALREGLDPGTFERGWVSKRDGVLLRANFRQGARWDAAAFGPAPCVAC